MRLVLVLLLVTVDTAAFPLRSLARGGRARGREGKGGSSSSGGSSSNWRLPTRRAVNREWFERRAANDPAAKRKCTSRRTKRWEREGDALHSDICIGSLTGVDSSPV